MSEMWQNCGNFSFDDPGPNPNDCGRERVELESFLLNLRREEVENLLKRAGRVFDPQTVESIMSDRQSRDQLIREAGENMADSWRVVGFGELSESLERAQK